VETPIRPLAQSRNHLDYYGYVRRIPAMAHCTVLFRYFFDEVNPIHSTLDEIIFGEQLKRWWSLAHGSLLQKGMEGLPLDIRSFPALIFQVLALTLQFVPSTYELSMEELKFGPSQTLTELSVEYHDCGLSLTQIVGRSPLTFIGVQNSSLIDLWLMNTGDLMRAWTHSGQTARYDEVNLFFTSNLY
jgi:hypothetical protein